MVSMAVADPEGGHGGAAPSKIDQNLAKLAPFVPILASTPPLTDHPGSAPAWSHQDTMCPHKSTLCPFIMYFLMIKSPH